MQVKEESVNTNYKSCQFENPKCINNISMCGGMTICGDNVNKQVTYDDMLNSTIKQQFQIQLPSSQDTSEAGNKNAAINPTNTTENTEMSHSLPKRISKVQDKLLLGPSNNRTLAQPKGRNRSKRPSVCRKWKNGSPLITNNTRPSITEYNVDQFQQISGVNHNNSKLMNITDLRLNVSNNQNTVPVTSHLKEQEIIVNDEESPQMEGLFGWTLIDNIYVPYIFRADNKKYVCVRLLEYKILKKYPNVFPEELAVKEPLTSSFIKPNECNVFNQLVRMQYRGQPDIPEFNREDVVVLLSDFMSFYSVVKKAFPDCANSTGLSNSVEKVNVIKSGWLQINNTIIPYICRSNVKFLPLAVLKHAASIDVPFDGVSPSDAECRELNYRCTEEGFHFTFKTSSRLVSLEDIKRSCTVHVVELPTKNPLHHAQYLSNEDQSSEGKKINTQESKVPDIQPLLPAAAFPNQRNNIELSDAQTRTYARQQAGFTFIRDPSRVQYGPPNVTIVPHSQHQHSKVVRNICHRLPRCVPTSCPQNRMTVNRNQMCPQGTERLQQEEEVFISQDFCSFNLERPKQLTLGGNPDSCRQPIIPSTFLNAFPHGHNINVNYGINIQNITPNQESNKHVECAQVQVPMEIVMTKSGGNAQLSSANINVCQGVIDNISRVPSTNISHPVNFSERSQTTLKTNDQSVSKDRQAHLITNQSLMVIGQTQPSILPESLHNAEVDVSAVNSQHETSYHMKQKQTIAEIKSCIKGVWLAGKNISCLHLNKPGRAGRFCLVEAICKLYFRNRTVSEFLFTVEKVLTTITCTELEEKAFIEYYQLPVNVLKCNKMLELTGFERMFPHLCQVLGSYPQVIMPSNVPYAVTENMAYMYKERETMEISDNSTGSRANPRVNTDNVIELDSS